MECMGYNSCNLIFSRHTKMHFEGILPHFGIWMQFSHMKESNYLANQIVSKLSSDISTNLMSGMVLKFKKNLVEHF